MKTLLTSCLLLFACMVQAQSIRYSSFYDSNSGAEILAEGVLLMDGSLVVAGVTSNSSGSGYGKAFNMVIDEDGSLQHSLVWEEDEKTIGVYAIVQTESGGIYEAGTIHDYSVPSLGTGDFFLAKLDQTGDTLFTKVFERPDTSDFMLDIVQTRPNKLMLIGWSLNDSVIGNADLMFLTVDTLGNELNRVVWGGAGTDYVHSACLKDTDGNVMMTGYTLSFGAGSGKSWVLQTDSVGNVQWHEIYSGLSAQGDGGIGISKMESDGNFVVVGGSNFPNESDAYMLKIEPDGNEIWRKRYQVGDNQGLYKAEELIDGTIVAAGQTTHTNDNSQAGWLIKTDENGDTLWTRTYNPSSLIDFIRFMLVMPNGDIVMLGDGRSPGEVNQDGWILRVDSMGCEVEGCWTVGVEELQEVVGLPSVYPNPVKDVLTIQMQDFSASSSLQITVLDMLGLEMLRFTQQSTETEIDVSVLKSGVYLLRVSKENAHVTSVKFVKE